MRHILPLLIALVLIPAMAQDIIVAPSPEYCSQTPYPQVPPDCCPNSYKAISGVGCVYVDQNRIDPGSTIECMCQFISPEGGYEISPVCSTGCTGLCPAGSPQPPAGCECPAQNGFCVPIEMIQEQSPADSTSVCGDGTCEAGETQSSCCTDCGCQTAHSCQSTVQMRFVEETFFLPVQQQTTFQNTTIQFVAVDTRTWDKALIQVSTIHDNQTLTDNEVLPVGYTGSLFIVPILLFNGTYTLRLNTLSNTTPTDWFANITARVGLEEPASACVQNPAVCGDGTCNGSENQTSCPVDCGCPTGTHYNGTACAPDAYCGDSTCNGSETQSSCCTDCGCASHYACTLNNCTYVPWCGDGACNGNETKTTCPKDCGCPAITKTYSCGGYCTNLTYYSPKQTTCTATASATWNGTACVGTTTNCCTYTTTTCTCPAPTCSGNNRITKTATCTTSGCGCTTTSTACGTGKICSNGACVNDPRKTSGELCNYNAQCRSGYCIKVWWRWWFPGRCR